MIKKEKKVFEGILFDVYQWEQKLFDGTYATFEKIKRIPSVQLIVITEDKKLIILEEEQPGREKYISLPGGMVERNEIPLETAKKELLEELGMVANEFKLWKQLNLSGKIEWTTYYYIAKSCKKITETKFEAGEKITPIFLDFKKYIEIVSSTKFKNEQFSNLIFRIMQSKNDLDDFKKELFN